MFWFGLPIELFGPRMSPKTKAAIESLSAYAEIRHTDSKARFCVVDGQEITFMLLDDEGTHPMYDVGVWVNTSFFSQALTELFELAWSAMKVVA